MYKPGDIVFLAKGTRPWNDLLWAKESHFLTHFQQPNDPLAVGPGKFHEVKINFEVPDEVTRLQVRLVSFSTGHKLSGGSKPQYVRDGNGAKEVRYLWSCEPVDNVLALWFATDNDGRQCHVYIDRFVVRKDKNGKLEPIERLVPIE